LKLFCKVRGVAQVVECLPLASVRPWSSNPVVIKRQQGKERGREEERERETGGEKERERERKERNPLYSFW
jgi:hypothetical protein